MNTSSSNKPNSQEKAFQEAERLLQEIRQRNGDLSPAYESIESAIESLEDSGYSAESLVPADSELGLGMNSAEARTGKGFWNIYGRVIRDTLCTPGGDLGKLAETGLAGSTSSLVTILMVTLSLPAAAIAIAAPIAAIIAALGVDAFCEWSSQDEEKRNGS